MPLGGRAPDSPGLRPARRRRRVRGHSRHRHVGDASGWSGCPRRCGPSSSASSRPTRPAPPPRRSSPPGIVPAAIEMMDALAIEAAEAAVQCNYPEGAGAVLVIELDGAAIEVEQEYADVERLCNENGAFEQRARHRPDRTRVDLEGPQVGVRRSRPDQPGLHRPGRRDPANRVCPRCSRRSPTCRAPPGVRVANVFHAGDGNLHPLVLFDDSEEGAGEAAEKVSGAILDLCIEHGGSITGEHGVGMDKSKYMPRMYNDEDLDTMQLVRCAFDPDSHLQPRQGLPDAAAVRGGARTAQGCPPAAGSRPRGGLLMSAGDHRPHGARAAIVGLRRRAGRGRDRRTSTVCLPGWSPGPLTPRRWPRCSRRPRRTA